MKREETNNTLPNFLSGDILVVLPLLARLVRRTWKDGEEPRASILHYHVLGLLMRRGPLPISEIARFLEVSKPNMTPLVDRMVEQGLVVREHNHRDRRVIQIVATNRGKNLIRTGKMRMSENLNQNLGSLNEAEKKRLGDCLQTLRTILTKISGSKDE
jgi:DNA-binding MarR family transcriptional regulator